jgi:hypothetical protein
MEIIIQLDLPDKLVQLQQHVQPFDQETSLQEFSNDSSVFKLA